jgi:hypothetical protein
MASRSERAMRRQQAQDDDAARASRTIWAGGIPDTAASEQGIRAVMRRCGDVVSVHVRRKSGTRKNWCLVMFRTAEDAEAACAETYRIEQGAGSTVGWNIRMVDPSKLRSLEAQFTGTGVQVDYAREKNSKDKAPSGELPELTPRFQPRPPSEPKPGEEEDAAPASGRKELSLEDKLNQYQNEREQIDAQRAKDAAGGQRSGRRAASRRNVDHQIAARAWTCLQLEGPDRVAESMTELLRWARGVDLFRGIEKKALTKILRRAKWQIAKPGETIISLGSPCTQMFVVVSGELQVGLPELRQEVSVDQKAKSVIDGLQSSLAQKKLGALEMMKDNSKAQHKLWSAQLAKNLGSKWKTKALQRVARARDAVEVSVVFGPTENVGRDKCISECQRLLDTDSANPVVASAAMKAGPRSANATVRVTQLCRMMVLDDINDVVAIGRAVVGVQEVCSTAGFRNISDTQTESAVVYSGLVRHTIADSSIHSRRVVAPTARRTTFNGYIASMGSRTAAATRCTRLRRSSV